MAFESLNRTRNIALAAILAAGLTLPAAECAYAAGNDADDQGMQAQDRSNKSAATGTTDAHAPQKSESVYIFAKADGSTKRTVVSNWLKNTTEALKLHDISSLANIQNTDGEETFDAKGASLIWNAQGNDIYYQGTTDKRAPIELKVTYWLDGKQTPAEQMAGKSGHVKIRFEFANHSASTEYVAGAARTIYTPFVCITGMALDNNVFRNISTKNAKALNDGDRTMIGGFAMPGLQDNLGVSEDTVAFPAYFEIEADAKNFEMGATATMVSSDMLNDLDTDDFDTGELGDALNQLSDAMNQVVDGTSKLYDGMEKLNEGGKKLADGTWQLGKKAPSLAAGVNSLAEGTSQLAEGAGALSDGTAQLKNGATGLEDGASQVAAGASALADSTPTLKQGASDVAAGAQTTADNASQIPAALSALKDGLSGILQLVGDDADKENSTLFGIVNLIQDGLAQLVGTDADPGLAAQMKQDANDAASDVGGASSYLEAQDTNLQNAAQNVDATSDALETLKSDPAYESLDGTTKEAIDAATSNSSEAAQQIGEAAQANADAQDTLSRATSTLQQTQNNADQVVTSLDEIATNADEASKGLSSVKDGVEQATNAIGSADDAETLLGGATALEDGTAQVAAGAQGVSQGAAAVDDGASQLNNGAAQVQKGAKQLNKGAGEVDNGAGALSDGADKLEAGAQKLSNAVPALVDGIKALAQGTGQLSDGIGAATDGTGNLKKGLQRLNEEGIQKLVDEYEDNLGGLSERLKATVDAGKAYDTFTGKSDDMQGSVKFIFETEAIEIDDSK